MPTNPTPIPPPARFNDALLDAAERVIFRDGISSFTLDAVAAEAKLSKGGLLHHFPSKNLLLESLVARTVAHWRADVDEAIASVPAGPGRTARGLLNGCIASPDSWTEHMRRSGMVLVAAMISSNTLVQPVREMHLYLRSLLESDGLRPGTGDSIALAMDGLWLGWIFGLHEVSAQRLEHIREALERALEHDLTWTSGKPVARGAAAAPIPRSRRGTPPKSRASSRVRPPRKTSKPMPRKR